MRFRFSIRDLLWLTALVAVLVAWWLDHQWMLSRDRVVETGRQGQPVLGVPLVPIPPPAKIPVNLQNQSDE